MNRITYISFSRIEQLGLVYILDISIYTLVIYMCHTTVATLLGLFILVVLRFDVGFSFHKRSTSFWQHVYSYMSNARLVSSSTNDVQVQEQSIGYFVIFTNTQYRCAYWSRAFTQRHRVIGMDFIHFLIRGKNIT